MLFQVVLTQNRGEKLRRESLKIIRLAGTFQYFISVYIEVNPKFLNTRYENEAWIFDTEIINPAERTCKMHVFQLLLCTAH